MTEDIQYWVKVAQYTGAAACMGLGAIGAAIGEGYTAGEANLAISRNPKISGDVFKTMLVGQAVAESPAIFALVISMIILFAGGSSAGMIKFWTFLSAGLCMGFGAVGSGIGGGFPAAAACEGTARQPGAGNRLVTNMLVGSAISQTPAIYALVVALVLIFSDFTKVSFSPAWAAVLGAGLSTGIAAIGPSIGIGRVAGASCEGVARNPSAMAPVTNTMLLGAAVTETTAIYGLLVSLILLFKSFPATETLAPTAFALVGSGICMGLGAIGPGIGEGLAAQSTVAWIARNTDSMKVLVRSMLVGQAVSESTGIYSLVISLILIFAI